MHLLQKLVSLTIPASFVVLSLPFLVECSLHKDNQAYGHKSIKASARKRTFDIALHGVLLWASMGFLMPVAILIIRISNREECNRTRLKLIFYLHAILQMLAVLLATAGAILSLKSFENSFSNSHQRVGLALYVAIWVQAFVGFRRPQRGGKGRSLWYFLHWMIGTIISLVGILNIYTGLKAYNRRTSRSNVLWTILFTAEVSLLGFFYLFQDKWNYMKKQGMVMGNEQPITPSSIQQLPQRDNSQKEELNEPSRKSNALGAYFSRSNALKKLFQST